MSDISFSEDQKIQLLRLYQDIEEADRDCQKIQEYIENNEIIRGYEDLFDLRTGYLFDEFMDFEYTEALKSVIQTPSRRVALSVATVWKRQAALEELQGTIDQIKKCYPREYK